MYLNGYVDGYLNGWFAPLAELPPIDFDTDTPLERTRSVPFPKRTVLVKAVKRTVIVKAAVRLIAAHEDPTKMLKYDPKDPDDRDDFKIDWTSRLAPLNDTVAASVWAIVTDVSEHDDPIEIETSDILSGNLGTRVWLINGDAGKTYQLRNRVTTAGGRILDQTIQVSVKEK